MYHEPRKKGQKCREAWMYGQVDFRPGSLGAGIDHGFGLTCLQKNVSLSNVADGFPSKR